MKFAAVKAPMTSIRHQSLALLLGATALFGMPFLAQVNGGEKNPQVIPPHADFRGRTYGEWEAVWWQVLFSVPAVNGDHPIFNGGALGIVDGVMLLCPAYFPTEDPIPPVDVTVPPGTAIFVPVVSYECSVLEPDPAHGNNEAELRACANSQIDHISGLFAAIDGKSVKHLNNYRVQSPLFVYGPLPADNVLNAVYGGTFTGTSLSVDAGVYLLLAPLSVGTHTLHIGGTFDDQGFTVDTTFNITVVRGKDHARDDDQGHGFDHEHGDHHN